MPEETHLPAVVEGPRAAMQVLPEILPATLACSYIMGHMIDVHKSSFE